MKYPYLRSFLELAGCDSKHIGKVVKRAQRAQCTQDVLCQSKDHGWLSMKDLTTNRLNSILKDMGNKKIQQSARAE